MVGSLSYLVGEIPICSGDLAFFWFSSADKVFVLVGEVGEGSTLAGSSIIEMLIYGSPIPSSFSLASKPFLVLSP